MVPIWVGLALLSAVFSAARMLLGERLNLNPYALAIWVKIIAVIVGLPFVVMHGLPQAPAFYFWVTCSAFIWAVSDVLTWKYTPILGAGVVLRILPGAAVVSFILWFFIRPELLGVYLQKPILAAGIFLTMVLWAWSVSHLRKCTLSSEAVRRLWFVIFSFVFGGIIAKLAMEQAGIAQGPYAFLFVEALIMLCLWAIHWAVRRPAHVRVLFTPDMMRGGFVIGLVCACMVLTNMGTLYYADNPAYLPAIRNLDAILILLGYAAIGRKYDGNIVAGLSAVACASALIILKAQY